MNFQIWREGTEREENDQLSRIQAAEVGVCLRAPPLCKRCLQPLWMDVVISTAK